MQLIYVNQSWGVKEKSEGALSVSLFRAERRDGIAAAMVISLRLLRIAVDEIALVERVAEAAHFVLELVERRAGLGIDDFLVAELVAAHVLGHEAAAVEKIVRAGEVRDIDRDVVAVIRRNRIVRLAEDQFLIAADRHVCGG